MIEALGSLSRLLQPPDPGVWIGAVPGAATIFVNGRFTELFGVTTERCATPPLRRLTGEPFDPEELPFAIAVERGEEVVIEASSVTRSGADARLRIRATPERSANGLVERVVVTAIDVTEEAHLRELLFAREQLMRTVEHAPVALWSIDRAGRITLSEGGALSKLGVGAGELVGRNVFDLYGEHPTIPANVRRALEGQLAAYVSEVGDVIFETWLAPLSDMDGQLIGAVGVSSDVTERTRLQRTLVENDRTTALGRLAASMAHEVNNPLTYAMIALGQAEASVDRLARLDRVDVARAEARDALKPALEIVRDGLRSIATVTADLRTFSRPQEGASVLDVRRVAQSALRLVTKEAERRATIHVELAEVPPVLANEARLGQVLLNLLHNALHAMSDKPGPHELEVSTRVEDGAPVVIVSDTGPGVPRSQRERIFDPFVTTKPVGVGTGLGLFVSRNIVRAMGGDITVGDRPGGGAEFRVHLLPADGCVARAPGAPLPSDAPVAAPVRRARILVIDDDARVGDALGAQLRAIGHDVTQTGCGAAAIELLTGGEPFDLCFCDVMMANVSGIDVFDAVRRRAPGREAKIVFMTGGAFTEAALRFCSERGVQAIYKPFDIVREAARRLGKSP